MTFLDLPQTWVAGLREWGASNDSVQELWLFGSRARGTSTPESDVDIALVLWPPRGLNDWALGNYVALHGKWKAELEAIVGRHVSLEAIAPGTEEDEMVRRTGTLLVVNKPAIRR